MDGSFLYLLSLILFENLPAINLTTKMSRINTRIQSDWLLYRVFIVSHIIFRDLAEYSTDGSRGCTLLESCMQASATRSTCELEGNLSLSHISLSVFLDERSGGM